MLLWFKGGCLRVDIGGLVGIAEKAKRAVQEKIKKGTALDERGNRRINVASLSMAFEASLGSRCFPRCRYPR